MSKKKILKLK